MGVLDTGATWREWQESIVASLPDLERRHEGLLRLIAELESRLALLERAERARLGPAVARRPRARARLKRPGAAREELMRGAS